MAKEIELTETENAVLDIMKSRWILGREKYGEGITFKTIRSGEKERWLDEAIEECADMLQYLVAFKLFLKNTEEKH